MPKIYTENMLDILETLGISTPDHINMNQRMVERLVAKINTALETYDPLPTGDAVAADVVAGKTFSNATGTGLTGELVFTPMPTPSAMINGNLRMVFMGAAFIEELFDKIELYIDDEFVGYATYQPDIATWYYDLPNAVTTPGEITVSSKYTPAAGVTLTDSAFGTTTFTAFAVTRELTGCVDENMQEVAVSALGVNGKLALLENFTALPDTIVVAVDDMPLDGAQFSYSSATGEYSILGDSVTGALKITAIATA